MGTGEKQKKQTNQLNKQTKPLMFGGPRQDRKDPGRGCDQMSTSQGCGSAVTYTRTDV